MRILEDEVKYLPKDISKYPVVRNFVCIKLN